MKKIISTGSIGVDHVFLVDKLPNKGQSILSKDFNIFCGGKGANQAVAIAKLGGNIDFIGRVGNDEGGELSIQNLIQNDINTSYVKKVNDFPTQVANIIVDKNGDNLLIVNTGANFSFKKSDFEEYKSLIDQADIALTQLETSFEFIEEFLKYASVKGKTIILNPGPAKVLPDDILKLCDFITPNETELCILLKKEYTEDFKIIEKYALELQEKTKKHVIVTLGQNGCLWINPNKNIKKFDAYKVKAVDATAAGDTFMGGFTTYLSQGKTIEQSILFATAASAITVTRLGAQSSLPTLDEVLEFVKNNS